MNKEQLYLKPNLVLEPLFERWYAWPHLISPATAAMNVTGRHLKIMDSYIQAPHIHAAAVANPKMLGGPFMDLKGKQVDEIKELRAKTMAEQEHLIRFSQAVKELDTMLKANGKGYSLEALYPQVPELLKGYVELVYDLNNNPSFRFYEPLLYKSEFYHEEAQSIALWLTENDERPFCLSTPRLNDKNVLYLDIPFRHKGIDALCSMKRTPGSFEQIKRNLNIQPEDEELFLSFFTDTPPQAYEPYTGDKIRMRYFGHACILIETKDVSILVDPLISYYGYFSDVSRFSDVHLPDKLDYILITHNHQDHILFETLLPLRHKTKNIIVPSTRSGALQDPNLSLMLKQVGFNNVVEIDEMETLSFQDCSITGIPFIGEHCDLNIRTKTCHHVKIDDFSMLFLADSCNIESQLYRHIVKETGPVDVMFLGMECDGAPLTWLYGPLLTVDLPRDKDQSRRLAGSNFERGMSLVDIFNPQEIYVYAMGQEPWLEFISSIRYSPESNPIVASNKLIETSIQQGRVAERLFGEKELFYSRHAEELIIA